MQESQPRFVPLAAKSVVCHTITYFLMGALAYKFLHYAATINNPNSGMRPTTSTWVLLGPALQIFRGILFASVFCLFCEQLFGRSQDRSRDSSIRRRLPYHKPRGTSKS